MGGGGWAASGGPLLLKVLPVVGLAPLAPCSLAYHPVPLVPLVDRYFPQPFPCASPCDPPQFSGSVVAVPLLGALCALSLAFLVHGADSPALRIPPLSGSVVAVPFLGALGAIQLS